MKNTLFILQSGFTFDNFFWNNFINCLHKQVDYVFLNEIKNTLQFAQNTINKKIVGCGHSLGFIKLLNQNFKMHYMIGVQAFVNFCGLDINLRNHRMLELNNMINAFHKKPFNVVKNFQKICEYKNISDNLCIDEVLLDFEMLKKSFILKNVPTLIVHSEHDIIVPAKLVYDNFQNTHAKLVAIEHERHNMCYEKPMAILHIIEKFLNEELQ